MDKLLAKLILILITLALPKVVHADPTSFAIYDSATGGNELTTSINFGDRAEQVVGTNVKQIVGNVYLQINNRAGSPTWRLIVYTSNGVKGASSDSSDLVWDNDSAVKMTWKYNNPRAQMGSETQSVGSVIAHTKWLNMYKWFINEPRGGDYITGPDRTYATITHSGDGTFTGRLRLAFAVDLKSTYVHGNYRANLVFELAEN